MTDYSIKSPRKLIEVALPLDAINVASVRENYIYKGNPSSLHKWWAQRPLAAARAVVFCQFVNDPSWKWEFGGNEGAPPGHLKASWAASRKRLFDLITELVKWESNADEEVLGRAREEIWKSWRETCELNKTHPLAHTLFDPTKLPGLHDPFAGGGTIPLEGYRLGLDVTASDLNPIAVLLNKAMLEWPQKFIDRAPIGPSDWSSQSAIPDMRSSWSGVTGIAEDVLRYGKLLHQLLQGRIGHLYPSIVITEAMAKGRQDLVNLIGKKVTAIAWVWARTVASPNPAFAHIHVPVTASFVMSSKLGQEVYVQPIIHGDGYDFVVMNGLCPENLKGGTKTGRGSFRCLMSDAPISGDHIKREGREGRIGTRLMCIVIESSEGRRYLTAISEHEKVAHEAVPTWQPPGTLPNDVRAFTPVLYGLTKWSDLFTRRQTCSFTAMNELLVEIRSRVLADATASGMADDGLGLEGGGSGARAYAELIATYLMFAVNKHAMYGNSLVPWYTKEDRPSMLFTQQVVQMTWDFCELNPLTAIGGSLAKSVGIVSHAIEGLPCSNASVKVVQHSATTDLGLRNVAVSTDPPYYDNVPYADLADFFYAWTRPALKNIFPTLLATIESPKDEELVAAAHRRGSKEAAEDFFLKGMTKAVGRILEEAHPALPITIYYAFKQSETKSNQGTTLTGWSTFLEAISLAGLVVVGTWPMRTERKGRMRDTDSNALASSVILVCRKRPTDAPSVSRREFIRELNSVLPEALDEMTKGAGGEHSPVAPVDLSQAIIGPGMGVFSKYAAVLEADGSRMSVRIALQLINRFLAEDDFDSDTQFCLHWFEQHGWTDGPFGDANTLAQSKGTSPEGMQEAGVLRSGGGKVRLLKWAEYPTDWNPDTDARTPIWEALHQLIRALKQGGDSASGALLAVLGGKAEAIRQLAYRLYTLCERLGNAEDARAYNDLITSWTGIETAANSVPKPVDPQGKLFER